MLSVQEVPPVREDHRDAVLVRGLYDLIVAYGAAWLYDGLMPASASASTPSAKGKKASLAATAPCALPPAFFTAISEESTRLIWPAPTPTVAPSLARTMALLLTTRATRQAKSRSLICSGEGCVSVTTLYSESSSTASVVLEQDPARYVLGRESRDETSGPATSTLMFGLEERISLASSVKPGATSISVNTLEISARELPIYLAAEGHDAPERGLRVRS